MGLIQSDWHPYKNRKLGQEDTRGHMRRGLNAVNRQQEGDHQQARQRPRRSQSCQHLDWMSGL